MEGLLCRVGMKESVAFQLRRPQVTQMEEEALSYCWWSGIIDKEWPSPSLLFNWFPWRHKHIKMSRNTNMVKDKGVCRILGSTKTSNMKTFIINHHGIQANSSQLLSTSSIMRRQRSDSVEWMRLGFTISEYCKPKEERERVTFNT